MAIYSRNTLRNIRAYLREEEGIDIVDDPSVHAHCGIESKCVEAVKLRKIIEKAGLSLDTVLQKNIEYRKKVDDPYLRNISFPEIGGKLSIYVGQNCIETEMGKELEKEFTDALSRKIRDIEEARESLPHLHEALLLDYRYRMEEIQAAEKLPQNTSSPVELLKYNCTISVSSGGGTCWNFLFPIRYDPQIIYTNGQKYKISEEHRKILKKMEIICAFHVYRNNNVSLPILYSTNMEKFQHYHGDRIDCWGDLPFLHQWDMKIKTLAQESYRVEKALTVINRDSLVQVSPWNMISVPVLMEGSELLSEEKEEGTLDTTPRPPREQDARTRWGEIH